MKGPARLATHSILVVEDDYYVAADIATVLTDAGALIIGPFPSEEAAMQALSGARPSAAVLDLNLGGGAPQFGVARTLRRRRVPFAFLTGYGAEVIPKDLSDAPRIEKPADFQALVAVMAGLCQRRPSSEI